MFYFEKMMMASEHNKALVENAILIDTTDSNKPVDVQPGYFAVLDGFAKDEMYTKAFTRVNGSATNYYNYNVRIAKEIQDATSDVQVVVCDPAVVATAVGANGLVYRIGEENYGNPLEAGVPGRVRRLELGDVFKLGTSNFKSTPVVGQYAELTDGDYVLTPSATLPSSGFAVKIHEKISETTGAVKGFDAYIVEVVQL